MDLGGVREVPWARLGHDHRGRPEPPRRLLQPGPRDQAQQVPQHQPTLQVRKKILFSFNQSRTQKNKKCGQECKWWMRVGLQLVGTPTAQTQSLILNTMKIP